MGLFLGKKRHLPAVAVYLAVSILGVFTFLAVEPLRSIDLFEGEPASRGVLAPLDYTIDCLAEGPAAMSRGWSFSPLRSGHLRIPLSLENKTTGAVSSKSSLREIEKVKYLSVKDTILLKLLV
jgi:hypothetical protein